MVYLLPTPIPEDGGDDAIMKQIRKKAKWDNDDYICKGLILNEAKYMAEDASTKKFLDSGKPKGNNVAGLSVFNMVEHNKSYRYNDNKGKRKHHDNTRADPNEKAKPTCWKCGKTCRIKRDCKGLNVGNKANGSNTKGSVDVSSNSLKGAIVHVCKDRCCFKTYESLNDGSILHMGNESTALVHGRGCVDLRCIDITIGELSRHLGLEKGRYGVSRVFNTEYWGFLGVGITFDTAYWLLEFFKYLCLSSDAGLLSTFTSTS
ncbi:hypothetical protein Tco_1359997 [Tanacetum coccineum]